MRWIWGCGSRVRGSRRVGRRWSGMRGAGWFCGRVCCGCRIWLGTTAGMWWRGRAMTRWWMRWGRRRWGRGQRGGRTDRRARLAGVGGLVDPDRFGRGMGPLRVVEAYDDLLGLVSGSVDGRVSWEAAWQTLFGQRPNPNPNAPVSPFWTVRAS